MTKKTNGNTKAAAVLTRDAWLSVDDRETREVEVPGGKLLIREMDGEAVMEMVSALENKEDKESQKLALYRGIAQSVIDPETGERMFTMDDVAALQRKSWRTLNALQGEIMKLNGMAGEEADEAKNG